MPERWQQEVKRLGEVQPPDDVWRRAEQGPREPDGPSLPPRRQRVVAGVVAFVVFLAAGGFAWRALRPTHPSSSGPGPGGATVVATFKLVQGRPSGTLTTSEGVTDGFPGIPPQFHDKDFVQVPGGSLLAVESDATEVDGTLEAPGPQPFEEILYLGQVSDPVRLDEPAGRYILHLIPIWDQGAVEFFFPIELVSPPGSDAVLEFIGKNAPEASLTWGDTEQHGVRGDYEWCDASGRCVNGFPEFASYPPVHRFLQILGGTAVRLHGDAYGLEGILQTIDGETVSRLSLDDPGSVPTTPGRYVLELNVDLRRSDGERGSATFFFGIESTSKTSEPSVSPVSNELAGTSWRLESIDGTDVPAGGRPVTLVFTADRLGGVDGCNEYGGPYTVNGTSIKVGDVVSTSMLCGDGQTMDRAHALFEGLRLATSFELTADRLMIRSPSTALTFVSDPAP